MTHGLRILRQLFLLGLLSLGLPLFVSAAEMDELAITVTPAVDVSLALDVTSYAFGLVDVNTSTSSLTALNLTNNGHIQVTVDKRIETESNPVGWTAASSAGRDAYVLYCATSTVQPAMASFGAPTILGTQGNVTALTGLAGSPLSLMPSGPFTTTSLWFRLDMPTNVSSLQSRTITIRFTGTAP